MNPIKSGLAVLAVLAMITPVLSGQASAETRHDIYQRCIGKGTTSDTSPECTALRDQFQKLQQECMAAAVAPKEDAATSSTAVSLTSHGYKAHFLLCARQVHARLGNYGH